MERPMVAVPEDGYECEAGEKAEHLGPGVKDALEQCVSVQMLRGLQEGQLDGKEGEGDRVDAVGEGEESVEARISLGCQHLLLVLLPSPPVTANAPPCTRRASLPTLVLPRRTIGTGLFPKCLESVVSKPPLCTFCEVRSE